MVYRTDMNCPIPLSNSDTVQMAHGGGGRLSHDLTRKLFLPAFANPELAAMHDGAVLELGGQKLAFSTDSHVVNPLFFPGGDIGKLAVFGTVNDLAMCGARPLWLSAGFILEEGLPMETLQRVVASMRAAAADAGVILVTGDTKVVDRGKCDGLYINTAGIGKIEGKPFLPSRIREGDAIILSGDLARHGIAVMALREGLAFEHTIESDCASLVRPVLALIEAGIDVRCARDLTRGGLASALVEIANSTGAEIAIREKMISVREDVRGACEILGLDPLYVANEGRFAMFVPRSEADGALAILRNATAPHQPPATIIGEVKKLQSGGQGRVILKGAIGVDRIVEMLSGEQLPRIC